MPIKTASLKYKRLRDGAEQWLADLKSNRSAGSAYDPLTYDEIEFLEQVPRGTTLEPMPGRISLSPDKTIRAAIIRWLCSDKDAQALVWPEGIGIELATIVGEPLTFLTHDSCGLNLSSLKIPFPIILHHCHLPPWLLLQGTDIPFLDLDGCKIDSINADVLNVRGDLYMRCVDHKSAGGVIKLLGATIGGDLDLGGAKLRYGGAGKKAAFPDEKRLVLNADGIKVQGDVHFSAWTKFKSGANDEHKTNAQTEKVDFTAIGGISLDEAQIGSDLICKGAKFCLSPDSKKNENALTLRGATVKGNIYFSDNFNSTGAVRLAGATIGQSLDCNNGHFTNPWYVSEQNSGVALELDGAQVTLDLNFSTAPAPARQTAPPSKPKATSKAGIRNFLQRIWKFLKQMWSGKPPKQENAPKTGATACGTVSLVGAKIGRVFDCRFGKFSQWPFTGGKNNRSWTPALDLRGAHVGVLSYPFEFAKVKFPKGQLNLDGFVYDRIEGAVDRKTCLKWIDLQYLHGPNKLNFKSQPYQQLAKFLREAGASADARVVLFEMERARPRVWYLRLWGCVQRFTIGYGYLPLRALGLILALVLAGYFFYCPAGSNGLITPTDWTKYNQWTNYNQLQGRYVHFHPFLYSLENSQPFMKFGQSDFWQINPARPCAVQCSSGFLDSLRHLSVWLQFWRPLQIALGWILATMGVLGITGFIHKDQP